MQPTLQTERLTLRPFSVADAPEVQQCYYVTGQTDFILIVLAASMEDYEAFTRRALLDDANVHSFVTSVVLDRVKTGVSVPVRGADRPSPSRRKR